jgi:hypothetical protein
MDLKSTIIQNPLSRDIKKYTVHYLNKKIRSRNSSKKYFNKIRKEKQNLINKIFA